VGKRHVPLLAQLEATVRARVAVGVDELQGTGTKTQEGTGTTMTIAEREAEYFAYYYDRLSQRGTLGEADEALLREWALLLASRADAQDQLRNGTPTYIETVGHTGQQKLSPSAPWRTMLDTATQFNTLAAALGCTPRSRATQKSGRHQAPENESVVKLHDPFSELLAEGA